MTQQIEGIGDLLSHYNIFLIDQFGVLHDGVEPYPQVIDCLSQLKASGKTVVIVSNSGKRSSLNIQRMNLLGIDESLYDHFVTSGDVAHEYIKNHVIKKTKQLCFLISRDGDTSAIDNLGLDLIDNPNKADVIVISGSESDRYDEQHYARLLAKAASKKIVCLCTNPDKKMLTPNGIMFGAGRIAEIYQEHGGDVVWIGKPYEAIYSYIANKLQLDNKSNTLCIGDSIEHDIAGGKNSQLNTLLIRTGILAGIDYADLVDQFKALGVTPDFITAEFKF